MSAQENTWSGVWECPRCGFQMAVGHGTAVLDGAPKCSSFGHDAVEMEQKLAPAFPFTPTQAFEKLEES